jgi:murein DD-endopeptidase
MLLAVVGGSLVAASPAQAATAYTDSVPAGTILAVGDSISSSSGQFRLDVQSDGNTVLYSSGGQVLWNSNSSGSGAVTVVPQTDGNLVGYDAANRPVWQTFSNGTTAGRLAVQNDGNLVMYTAGNALIWASHVYLTQLAGAETLMPGWYIQNRAANATLIMQTDGNLVLYRNGAAAWQSATSTPGSRAVLQSDGNLVVYTAADVAKWQSGTSGRGRSVLALQNDGNLTLKAADGSTTWTTASPASTALIVPATGVVTGIVGRHCNANDTHQGIDIAGASGSGVFASAGGTVVSRVISSGTTGYGTYVIVQHAAGYSTLYGHLRADLPVIAQGSSVPAGGLLGSMGSTGNSTGTHVHFELRINGVAQNALNGYFTCGRSVSAGAGLPVAIPSS